MAHKNFILRGRIYDELQKAYPNWLTCSDLQKMLGVPYNRVYYYIEDMFFTQGFPPILMRRKTQIPRRNEYKAIP